MSPRHEAVCHSCKGGTVTPKPSLYTRTERMTSHGFPSQRIAMNLWCPPLLSPPWEAIARSVFSHELDTIHQSNQLSQ